MSEKYVAAGYRPTTLCEICANACGGCSWSEYGKQKPVEGWEAIRNDILTNHGAPGKPLISFEESYIVLACPQYAPDQYAERYPFDSEWAKKALRLRNEMAERKLKNEYKED